MKAMPYQEAGATFLADRKYALLADDPGLGKTIQTILALAKLGTRGLPAVVVCPASAVWNWQREFKTWAPTIATSVVTDLMQHAPLVAVTIMSYAHLSLTSQACQDLMGYMGYRNIKTWVFDEGQALKDPNSNRTRRAYGSAKAAGLVNQDRHKLWVLSGTPAPNNYAELFSHLRIMCKRELRDQLLDNYPAFRNHFCRTAPSSYGRDKLRIVGNRNAESLKKIMAPILLRRRKKEVLKDLPPLRFAIKSIGGTVDTDNAVRTMHTPLGGVGSPTEAHLKQKQIALSTERRMLGLAKVPLVVGAVVDEIGNNQNKLILFAHHREVMDQLEGFLGEFNPVSLHGGTKDKQGAVDKFQRDPNCRVFIGQLTAAGTAITLTAASRVMFAEYSWSPHENYQAACRAHRIGQKDGVLAEFCVATNTLDETIGRVVARKSQDLAELFG